MLRDVGVRDVDLAADGGVLGPSDDLGVAVDALTVDGGDRWACRGWVLAGGDDEGESAG